MTTNIDLEYAPDIRVKNGIMNSDRFASAGAEIAALSITTKSLNRLESAAKCLSALMENMKANFPSFERIIMIGNTAPQPKTRVAEYNRLWKGLEKKGYRIPPAESRREYGIPAKEGVKYFGYAPFDHEYEDEIPRLLVNERNSYLLFRSDKASCEAAIQKGWLGEPRLDLDMIVDLVRAKALISFYIGDFDDVDTGAIVLGPRDDIAKLVQK